MSKSVLLFLVLLVSTPLTAQISIDYFLPDNVTYNPEIPTPASVIGHEIGEWHSTHDRLVYYMTALANASDRVSLETYGFTHEKRPLLLLTITSTKNQQNINALREKHLDFSIQSTSPVVLWMGYSVHGNEPSGANASMLTAYYLAAAQGEAIEKKLDNIIVLMDPSINPDGLQRFTNWVNSNKSTYPNVNPDNLEQNEFWPKGRTNHYGFDLNRDWLLAQQPESKARLKKYHEWMPNVVTDHHEMRSNRTFFFQPGIPSRNNPLIPSKTVELTREISQYHAQYLDSIGSLYYTEESYDDFYFGKGSTYPDIHGGVGILFEQASSRSHARETDNGILTFPFTIRNQFVTSLSTFEATFQLGGKLLDHQRKFYNTSKEIANKNEIKGYIFCSPGDQGRLFQFLEILQSHKIEVLKVQSDISMDNMNFPANQSYVVPMEQAQTRLIQSLFEKRTSFTDSLFYDVSAWTLPLAFDLQYTSLDSRELSKINASDTGKAIFPVGKVIGDESNYAYLFEWSEYYAPRLLNELFKLGYNVKVTTKELESGGKIFHRGSILIPVQSQPEKEKIHDHLDQLSKKNGVTIYSVKTGYTKGVSLGSPTLKTLKKPEILLVVEEGVSTTEAGEIWHLLDHKFAIPVSRVPVRIINDIDLEKYSTIIMVSGNYQNLNHERIKRWVANGGNLLAFRTALDWINNHKIMNIQKVSIKKDSSLQEIEYDLINEKKGAQRISGVIFQGKLDLSHPLAFGYSDPYLPMFKNNKIMLERNSRSYFNPLVYTQDPLLAGYISPKNYDLIRNNAAIITQNIGQGIVIAFADNQNFRSIWMGAHKLIMNGIFFADLIDNNRGN